MKSLVGFFLGKLKCCIHSLFFWKHLRTHNKHININIFFLSPAANDALDVSTCRAIANTENNSLAQKQKRENKNQ